MNRFTKFQRIYKYLILDVGMQFGVRSDIQFGIGFAMDFIIDVDMYLGMVIGIVYKFTYGFCISISLNPGSHGILGRVFGLRILVRYLCRTDSTLRVIFNRGHITLDYPRRKPQNKPYLMHDMLIY